MAVAIRSLGLLFLAVNVTVAAAAACNSSNAFSLGEHSAKPTLGIQLFALHVRPEFPLRIMEQLRIYLAETLQARLAESGYFGRVTLLADDSDAKTDFTMVGAFTHVTLGTSGFSFYNLLTREAYDQPSTVNLIGGITTSKDAEPATTFQCELVCCQALNIQIPSTYGGVPVILHTAVGKSEASIARVGRELKTAYQRMERARTNSK